MKCTSCNNGRLIPAYLDDLFPCHTCDNCGGNWVMMKDYLRWKERHPEPSFTDVDIASESVDSHRAMLCPVTGGLMLKYRISTDDNHRLDLSPSVTGVWLDKGEWDLLKKKGLAGSLNAIFTDAWQRKLREALAKDTFDALYAEQFGEVGYERLKDIRNWIVAHPKKAELLAFLLAEDPYSASK